MTALLTGSFVRNPIYAICDLHGMTVMTAPAFQVSPATPRCPTRAVCGWRRGRKAWAQHLRLGLSQRFRRFGYIIVVHVDPYHSQISAEVTTSRAFTPRLAKSLPNLRFCFGRHRSHPPVPGALRANHHDGYELCNIQPGS
jgi:hypothetical protein